ncbi:MAG TPA: metallophosphoesterase [Verrucomicrobiae bacterium]|nr:metallophosphoesterase [Verrucomicrobiae bacterium]
MKGLTRGFLCALGTLSVAVVTVGAQPRVVTREVNLLAFGDWGNGSKDQRAVAAAMADYVQVAGRRPFDGVLVLGDNLCHVKVRGVRDPAWNQRFESMYDPRVLDMPFYALLGNHDYAQRGGLARIELDYGRAYPNSRWKMPAKWYRLDLPGDQPLVTVLMLDSMVEGEDWTAQLKWMEQELAKTNRAPWTICCAHFPLYSSGHHGDTPKLLGDWGPMFEKDRVAFYVCGHDHDLEHLEIREKHTSFLVSGGGGMPLYSIERSDRGPFARALHGFVHIKLTPEIATVRFVDETGRWVHVFQKTIHNEIRILHTTGVDKPTFSPPVAGAED